MSMVEALRHHSRARFEPVTSVQVDTIDELYNRVINLNRVGIETALGWWNALCDYVSGDGPLRVFVRKLEKPDKGLRNGRRGFVSCFDDGLSYVYCDNCFARGIYGLAKEPYAPIDGADIAEAVNSCRIKCLLKTDSGDEQAKDLFGNKYSVYSRGSSPRGIRGWKVAHIIGVNQFYQGDYDGFQKRNFTRGVLGDWTYDDEYGFLVRHRGGMEMPDDRNYFLAHFLRFANPMNYFLIPSRHRVGAAGLNSDISEEVQLLEYMRQTRIEEFGDAWMDFEEKCRFAGFGIEGTKQSLGRVRIDFSCHAR